MGGRSMGKMGRPKLSETRNKIVTLRLTEEEYQKLKGYSEIHQQTITNTIKKGVDILYKSDK